MWWRISVLNVTGYHMSLIHSINSLSWCYFVNSTLKKKRIKIRYVTAKTLLLLLLGFPVGTSDCSLKIAL